MAGMEILWGRASSVTEAWPRWSVVRMVRRVESLRAAKVASRSTEYLTIRLSIPEWHRMSRGLRRNWLICDGIGLEYLSFENCDSRFSASYRDW